MPGRLHHRRVWHPTMDPERFVFLDETGAGTNMIRRHGWRPRRERLVDAAPPTWRTTTLIAGPRSTGLVAPLCWTVPWPVRPSLPVCNLGLYRSSSIMLSMVGSVGSDANTCSSEPSGP